MDVLLYVYTLLALLSQLCSIAWLVTRREDSVLASRWSERERDTKFHNVHFDLRCCIVSHDTDHYQ
jgi:hypothetical protein